MTEQSEQRQHGPMHRSSEVFNYPCLSLDVWMPFFFMLRYSSFSSNFNFPFFILWISLYW